MPFGTSATAENPAEHWRSEECVPRKPLLHPGKPMPVYPSSIAKSRMPIFILPLSAAGGNEIPEKTRKTGMSPCQVRGFSRHGGSAFGEQGKIELKSPAQVADK